MRSLAFVLLGVAILLQSYATCNEVKILERRKRGLLDLVVTLWCYRNKLKVPLLGINLYGCYCGIGGSGLPVDEVDRCCFLHDCCYYHSRVVLKCHAKVKWEFYNFTCAQDQTKCTSQTVCGRTACECDRQLAECLTHAKPKRKHFFYNRMSFCGSKRDTCPSVFHNATLVFPGKKYLSPPKKQAAKFINQEEKLLQATKPEGDGQERARGSRPNKAGQRGSRPNEAGQWGSRPNEAGQWGSRPNEAGQWGSRPNEAGQRGSRPNEAGQRGSRPNEAGQRGSCPNEAGQRGLRPNEAGQRGSRPNEAGQGAIRPMARDPKEPSRI